MPSHETSDTAAGSFAVWRTDDNGNSFVVRERLTHAEAERVVSEFTARGHKQYYWIERETREVVVGSE